MSEGAVPQDVGQWLESLGLPRRLMQINKNIVNGFVDGLLVSEIVAARFPRLVQLHNYCDTASASGRLKNWEILNKKVLPTIDCELGEADIEKISNRQIQRVAIVTFLRLLRAKLDAHAPTYHAEQQAIAAAQKKKAEEMSLKAFGERAEREALKLAEATAADDARKLRIDDQRTAALGGRRPSQAKSRAILAANKDTTTIRAQVRAMSDADIDERYNEVSAHAKAVEGSSQYRINKMAARSKEISDHMSAIRTQNLDDIRKIDKRLCTLHNQLNILEKNPNESFLESGTTAMEETLDEKGNASMIGVSRRGSVLTSKLLNMIPEGAKAKPNKEMEREITRRSSVVLKGLKIPDLSSLNFVGDDDKEEGEENGGGASSVFAFQAGQDSPEPSPEKQQSRELPTEASHRRVYDASRDRHFYVDTTSGSSSWAPPKQGIINCVDEKTGRVFYTNASTKASGWRIEEVAR